MPTQTGATAPFAIELSGLLAELGVSQRALGRRIHVNQAHLSRILGGQTVPTVVMIDTIAAALDLPPDYFIESQLRTISAELQTNDQLRHEVYRRVLLAAATKPRRSVRR